MEDDEVEKKVKQYLQRKGFRLTELALQQERNRLSTSGPPTLRLTGRPDNDPARYRDGYSKLRTWAYSSLDQYKLELLHVFYPVFIHCFMDLVAEGHMQEARSFFHTFREGREVMHLYSRDLQKLEGVLSPSHLEIPELHIYLLCSNENFDLIFKLEYSYELLLQYLQKRQALVVLGVINEHIAFEVSPGQPSLICDDADVVALIGTKQGLGKTDKSEGSTLGVSQGERISTVDEGKRPYTLFQGHSGPVYSAAFSPFGDFLLPSSSDSTIRLWSTKLNANLVCYKGHNYPVWDVQFSPVGHYFASASHDRTARICCEGALLASGSADCTVKLWDVASSTKALKTQDTKAGSANLQRLLKALATKSTPVHSLRFSRRNLLFASGVLSLSSS
ncbi:Transcription initiation factor TFIID subunit 5 [Dichanthelium oligosanthes]|uniref:Transcription initiation factor TFIID subunit 5 n=1 Tax=Dichanthelium oligosanthes TaxID=888268 RepID=A0A1E5VR11_9POAL|nr:Transcription initiation factor TFIID subunit 5 [Dichanthelium oligosanthes]